MEEMKQMPHNEKFKEEDLLGLRDLRSDLKSNQFLDIEDIKMAITIFLSGCGYSADLKDIDGLANNVYKLSSDKFIEELEKIARAN